MATTVQLAGGGLVTFAAGPGMECGDRLLRLETFGVPLQGPGVVTLVHKHEIAQLARELLRWCECAGTGVIETGNNDLPCACPLGDLAMFNTTDGPRTGAEVKRALSGEEGGSPPA